MLDMLLSLCYWALAIPDNSRGTWMHLTSGVCGIYYAWRAHVCNKEVHQRTDQPLAHIIRATHLKFFGHIARADRSMDHSQALRACVAPLPRVCNCRSGQPHHTWFRAIESYLAPLNICLSSNAASSSLEHTRRNGNVQPRTSHTAHNDDDALAKLHPGMCNSLGMRPRTET